MGSTRAFAALHAKMLAVDRFAVARLQTTTNSQIRLVALVAQREEFDEDGAQIAPPGMVAIALPWADDIRAVPKESDIRVAPTAEMVDAAVDVVNALAMDGFESTAYNNPMLQKFYAHLEASGRGVNYSPLLSLAQRVVATRTSTCGRTGRRPKLPRFTKWRCVTAPALAIAFVFQEL